MQIDNEDKRDYHLFAGILTLMAKDGGVIQDSTTIQRIDKGNAPKRKYNGKKSA